MDFQWLRHMLQIGLQLVFQWFSGQWETVRRQPKIDFDPKTQEIVSKEFVKQADENYAMLYTMGQALKETAEQCDKIRQRWRAVSRELNDLKTSNQSLVVDDAEITAKWKQLQSEIKNLARTPFRGVTFPEGLTSKHEGVLASVDPPSRHFFETMEQTDILFECLLWDYIAATIFSPPTMVWGEEISEAFDTFKANMDEKGYRIWRAQTAGLLQVKTSSIGTEAELHMKSGLSSLTADCIPEEVFRNTEHADVIRRSVDGIVGQAIELAVIFNRSRCDYRLEPVADRKCFRPEHREHAGELAAHHFDLMISPALVKYGDAGGGKHDQSRLLAESQLYCLPPVESAPNQGEEGEKDGGREWW